MSEERTLPVNCEEHADDGYTPVETNDRMVVGNLIKYTSDSGWTEGGLPVSPIRNSPPSQSTRCFSAGARSA